VLNSFVKKILQNEQYDPLTNITRIINCDVLTVVLIAVQVQQCTKIHVHGRMCIAADIVAVIIRIVEVQCTGVGGPAGAMEP